MKILYVTTGLSLGGAERQLALMSGIMASRGHEVMVVSLIPPPLSGGVRFDPRIKVSDLGMSRGRAGPMAILRLSREIGAFKPDVVHSHMIHANMLACATRFVRRMPRLVCTAHSDAETESPLLLALYRALSRKCDVFTHVSEAAAARYAEIGIRGPRGIVAVHNGIEWERFATGRDRHRMVVRDELGIGPEERVFLFMGRMEPIKGPDIALSAFRALEGERADVHLLMVGEGTERVGLMASYAAPSIHWIGPTAAPARYHHAADCLLVPSRHEGFGLAIAEALAAGIDVIAADCPGPREILSDGEYGKIVPCDDPEALLRGMREILDSEHLPRETHRKYSRERFDAERIADEWIRVYGQTRGEA